MTSHIEHTREFFFATPDQTRLFVRDWAPAAHRQRQGQGILLMHGLGEHCGRYAHVARFFAELGFHVRSYDHRGHGQSEGKRGDSPDSLSLVGDAQHLLLDFARQLKQAPLLLGHSMGGLFAARLVLESPELVSGLILSSPALQLFMTPMQHQLLALARRCFPGLGVNNGLKTHYLSHDAEVVQAYKHDPLVHNKITARLLSAMLNAITYVQDYAEELAVPCLLLVAEADHLVNPEGSRLFVDHANNQLLHFRFYPEFYHEILNELDAQLVFEDIRIWLENPVLHKLDDLSVAA